VVVFWLDFGKEYSHPPDGEIDTEFVPAEPKYSTISARKKFEEDAETPYFKL